MTDDQRPGDAGPIYWKPASDDTGGWRELGTTTTDGITYTFDDEWAADSADLRGFDTPRSVTCAFPIPAGPVGDRFVALAFGPAGAFLAAYRRARRVSDMHRKYRARRGRRW